MAENIELKKILIISPHFPPSNLASVHRARLFAQHLPKSDWEPVILTVHEKYYEEPLDHNLEKMLPQLLRIEKVNAFPVLRPRLIGDIGLRAFFHLYKKAKQLIKKEKIEFLYILIPSFYCALLGRLLHASTGIKYGIDYIDPWVHIFPGSNKIFSRHWFSTKLAKILEPIAVKKACLITGVAEGYYKGVAARNPHLLKQAIFAAMPYGGKESDYIKMRELGMEPYLFQKNRNKIKFVYAGAILPKAYLILEAVFISLKNYPEHFQNVEFHFIGTGKRADDVNSYTIKPLAEKYGLWQTIVFEYPKRINYLDVLVHLNAADAIFILGSTEPHYTPSKVYQAVLSAKPILAVLHTESSAVKVLRESYAGIVLNFNGENELEMIKDNFAAVFTEFKKFISAYNYSWVKKDVFNKYSAENITKQLACLLEQVIA